MRTIVNCCGYKNIFKMQLVLTYEQQVSCLYLRSLRFNTSCDRYSNFQCQLEGPSRKDFWNILEVHLTDRCQLPAILRDCFSPTAKQSLKSFPSCILHFISMQKRSEMWPFFSPFPSFKGQTQRNLRVSLRSVA